MKHLRCPGRLTVGNENLLTVWESECEHFTTSCFCFFSRCPRHIISGGCGGAATGEPGFSERFARYHSELKQALTNRHIVWIHAVSVGEVNLCTQIIRALELRAPNVKIRRLHDHDDGHGRIAPAAAEAHQQNLLPGGPAQIRRPRSRASSTRRPSCWSRRKSGRTSSGVRRKSAVPVFLANARLSDKSFRGYKRFGFLFRPLFASFAGVGVQNEEDAARLREVGCRPEAVRVVGNLKFDAAKLDERHVLDVPAMLRQIGVPPDAPILVAGSTHDGEEIILAEIARRLRVAVSETVSRAGAAPFRALPRTRTQVARRGT